MNTPCLNHPGPYNPGGYPSREEHRAAWVNERGPIPPSMTVDHRCENRRCLNVEHMRLLTRAENTAARSFNERKSAGSGRRTGLSNADYARRTHCANGHDWNETNIRVQPDGYTACRPCQADSSRRSKARYRELAGY
jgi:hypothetical protein